MLHLHNDNIAKLTALLDPKVTERGLSCSDFSISSRKVMMLCSLASESSAPPSGSAGWWLRRPWRSMLSVVKEFESPSLNGQSRNVAYAFQPDFNFIKQHKI